MIMRRLISLAFVLFGMATASAAQTVVTPPPPNLPVSLLLTGIAHPRLKQVTRDGTRVLLGMAIAPGAPVTDVLVLDTRTSATIFDSRSLASPTRRFTDALLTADGTLVIYAEIAGGVMTVRARDLATGTERVVFTTSKDVTLQATNDDATLVAFVDASTSPATPGFTGPGRAWYTLGNPCGSEAVSGPVTLSGDGSHGVYQRNLDARTGAPVIFDTTTGTAVCENRPLGRVEALGGFHLDRTGRWLAYTAGIRFATHSIARVGSLLDRDTGARPPLDLTAMYSDLFGMSDDARHVLLFTGLLDWRARLLTRVAASWNSRLSGDGRTVVKEAERSDSSSEATGEDRIISIVRLDADGDGLNDGWETTFGLDPSNAADPGMDPDADGRSSAQEYESAAHPTGIPVRLFAEGAVSAFFDTHLGLFNPGATDVMANVLAFGPDGGTRSVAVSVPASRTASVNLRSLVLPFEEFALVVESPVALVTERRMTWARGFAYGSHSSQGVEAPSRNWYFAEGATIGGLQTFFLLFNPDLQPATVRVQYLLATGTVHQRVHVVPGGSRLTVWVNQEGTPLDAAEFATTMDADAPIVAERAMYLDGVDGDFTAGSVATGLPSPASSWWFAEGATGDYFDTFLLLANPGHLPAHVTVTYLRAVVPGDSATTRPVERTYIVPPLTRSTIRVRDEAQELRSTPFSAFVEADEPILAERSMWWPGPTPMTWREAHAETGASTAGTLWAVADVQIGYESYHDTFLLIANTSSQPALARVSLTCFDRTILTRDIALLPHRNTLWFRQEFPEIRGTSCGTIIESLPVPMPPGSGTLARAALVVECARYTHASVGGEAVRATRLPDPPN
jgi:hypothetical protein